MTPKLRILTTALWAIAILAMCSLLASWTTSRLVARRTTETPAVLGTGTESLPDLPAPAFAMTDQDNAPFSSGSLRGKAWVVDFFFTTCTGPCPAMTAKMAALAERLSGDARIAFVSFSVDPETDTPALLKEYAGKYTTDPRWHFLTGGDNVAYNLARDFKLAVLPAQGVNPIIHTTKFVLVSPDGKIAGYYDYNSPDELDKLVADAKALVATE